MNKNRSSIGPMPIALTTYLGGVASSYLLGDEPVASTDEPVASTAEPISPHETTLENGIELAHKFTEPYSANPPEAFGGAAVALLTVIIGKKISDVIARKKERSNSPFKVF